MNMKVQAHLTKTENANNIVLLQQSDKEVIEQVITELIVQHRTIETEQFANDCQIAAHQLPLHLRRTLNDFRNRRISSGYLLVKGFQINDESIGSTPSHWDAPWINSNILREEIFQCLISSCTGDLFGWLTQENGRYLRHIVPIEADKNEQLGGSSSVVLLWHIEEAFHPMRADMMTIMCYRNIEQATTNLCSVFDLDIPPEYRNILSQPRFVIEPDKSHFPENNVSQRWQLNQEHFARIYSILRDPKPVAVLHGKLGHEFLVIDEAFMTPLSGDIKAKEALDWLHTHMTERRHAVTMEPGDLLLIDNRTTVHGRSAYVPNYGPKARWLRRVNITTDLVKSHEWKEKPSGRIIF